MLIFIEVCKIISYRDLFRISQSFLIGTVCQLNEIIYRWDQDITDNSTFEESSSNDW